MIFGGRLYANRSGACKAGYSSRTGTAVKIRTSDQLRGQSRRERVGIHGNHSQQKSPRRQPRAKNKQQPTNMPGSGWVKQMSEIKINTQAECDALPAKFAEWTEVHVVGQLQTISRTPDNCVVRVCGSAKVDYVCGSAKVDYVYDSATVGSVCGSAKVDYVYDSATVGSVYDSAKVGSVYDSATVVRVYGSAKVGSVCGSAKVGSVYDSATVVRVYGSATVGSVCGSAKVGSVYDSATVGSVCGSAKVDYVYGSAKVGKAAGTASLHLYTDCAPVLLGFAVAFVYAKAKANPVKKSKTATVIKVPAVKDAADWAAQYGVEVKRGKAILYKRVSKAFLTQEGTPNETDWSPGRALDHPNWSPRDSECGAGKFHACPAPAMCLKFRNKEGDRYVAIQVAVSDLYPWTDSPNYPEKIAVRRATVLFECDSSGEKIEPAATPQP